MEDGYLNNVFTTDDKRSLIRTTPHKYDAWFTESFLTAWKVALLIGGVVKRFNPINGELKGVYE